MKKAFILIVIGLVVGMAAVAQNATVADFSGKVEYRLGSGAWQGVRVGLVLPRNATISTGFSSTATLSIGSSTVGVAQLTRLTVEELADDGSTVSTGIFVPVGRVRASVAETPNRSTDFTVRTAQSTAAVRGTEFETNGWQLAVSEGIVEFANLLGQGRNVSAGQISATTGGAPSDPADELNSNANVGDEFGPDDFDGPPSSGEISGRWQY